MSYQALAVSRRISRLPLVLGLLPLLALAVGCGGAVETDTDTGNVQSTREAVTASPLLVASPSTVDFGRVPAGSTRQLTITIANRSATPAFEIAPDPRVPPDPCVVMHNPPGFLEAYGSGTMTIAFTAPRALGPSTSSIVLRYQDRAGTSYTTRIPVQGTSY